MKFLGCFRRCTFVFKNHLLNSVEEIRPNTPRSCLIRNLTVNHSCSLFTSTSVFAKKKKAGTLHPTIKMAQSILKPQYFDYFLVLDFEATCQENEQIHPQEIIEFPVLKINSKTLETEAIFHQYVQPRVHKDLTPFCTKLTGIMQDMVDGQPHIEEVLEKFDKWMAENNLLDENVKSLFVTCGDWDLLKMLPKQAGYFRLKPASYFNQWLNIKKAYAEITSTYPKGMMPMLEGLNIPHQGRHHSGIDDCKNIGNILKELLKRGYVAKVTGSR